MKNILLNILLILSFLTTTLSVKAQQIPAYNQHLYLPETFNPARMGNGYVALGYRQQYLNLGTNASPQSFFLIADLSKAFKLSEKRIGIGLSLQSDKAHIIQRNQLNAMFTYHLVDKPTVRLSAGVSAGILLQEIKFNDAQVNDLNDFAIFKAAESKMTFDGGSSLMLHLNPGENAHHIYFDASLPQLFTSNINYLNDKIIADLQPHLQIRTSYRYKGDQFSIEPLFMYRDLLGNKKVNAAGIDGAIKLGFLDDLFWVGAGMRFNAETYHFTGSVRPFPALQIQAGMELHSKLGNSIELGLFYRFGENITKKPDPKSSKINAPRILMNAAIASVSIRKNYDVKIGDLSEKLKTQEIQAEELSKLKGYAEKLKRLNQSEQQLSKLKSELSSLKPFEAQIKATLDSANKAIAANSKVLKNTKDKNNNQTITVNQESIINSNQQFEQRISSLETKLRDIRNTLQPEIVEVVSQGNSETIRQFFQKRLDELLTRPRDLQTLRVEIINNKPVLVYQFSNGLEQFDISKNGLADVRSLLDHIIIQVNDLKLNKLKVNSINMLAKLRDSEKEMRTPAGTYNQELGNAPLKITYQSYASPSASSSQVVKSIQRGTISIIDLSLLKILSMSKYLESKGITEKIILEQSFQNKEQVPLQVYTVRIYLDK